MNLSRWWGMDGESQVHDTPRSYARVAQRTGEGRVAAAFDRIAASPRAVDFAAVITATSMGATASEPVACGTSRANDEQLRTLQRVAAEQTQGAPLLDIMVRHSVIVVPNDDTIAPLNRSSNLTGKPVTFE